MRLVPVQIRAIGRRRLLAVVEQRHALLGVAVGRVLATHAPQREVSLDREREARQPAQPVALVRRCQERIGDRVDAEQRGPRVALADEDVLVRVAQREARHGRTSRTVRGHQDDRVTRLAQRRRHIERHARRPDDTPGMQLGSVGVPADRELAVPAHRLALQADHATRRTPMRTQLETQPVEREPMRGSPVRCRLRPKHRDGKRHHDKAQRRRQERDHIAQRHHQHQRRGEIADRPQRHAPGHRQRPPIDPVHTPVDLEDAPVGADDDPVRHRPNP